MKNPLKRFYYKFVLPLTTAGAILLTSCIGGATPVSTPTPTPVEYRTPTPTRETTPTPQPIPIIEKLSWSPIREVNNRIYDINVIFELGNATNLDEVRVSLIPVQYEHLSPEAFPREDSQVKILEARGLEEEMFSVDFQNLKGGREYEIEIEAEDENGNIVEENMMTSYIREFENVAPLDDTLVGVFYYPWFGGGNPHWPLGYLGTPLLGEYNNESDSLVISKHIDMATGHGIDFFVMSWWGIGSEEDIAIKNFLKNYLANQIKFFILYEEASLKWTEGIEAWPVIDMSDPENVALLLRDVSYIATNYFSQPNHLTIRGSYPIFIYDVAASKGDLAGAYEKVRKSISDMGYSLYLMGDIARIDRDPLYTEGNPVLGVNLVELHDGASSYTPYHHNPEVLTHPTFEELLDERYALWSNFVDGKGRDFIPAIIAGYDSTKDHTYGYRDPPEPVLERSPEAFGRQVEIAKKYMRGVPMFLITTWNEMHEGTHIEPTVEEGYSFLKTLKNNL